MESERQLLCLNAYNYDFAVASVDVVKSTHIWANFIMIILPWK